jgi:hypothetical protein
MGEVEMSGWQPIETAPRDGTNILIVNASGRADWGHNVPRVACWQKDGWWGYHETEQITPHRATHWMPLPSPPSP